jgi:hypothetical protein
MKFSNSSSKILGLSYIVGVKLETKTVYKNRYK